MQNVKRGVARPGEDTAKRKRAEEEASRMVTVVRDSNDAITIQDFEGRITAWNRGAELMYGYSEEEALQMNIGRLTPPDKEAEQKDFLRRIFAGEKVTSFETQRLTKDGRLLDVWMVVTKLVDAAGKVIGIASTERDITERKRLLNKSLEEKAKALEQVIERERLLKSLEEKTKELEQVLYTASHDLRSPLVNIQGFAKELEQSLKQVRSLLQSKDISPEVREKLIVPLDEDIPDALQYIHASAYKIDTLLKGLLQLSRLGRAELDIKRLNMNKLMESVIHTFEFSIEERGVKLEVGDLPPCRGDETRINQLFSNLIDNAFKFLDPDRPGIIKINGTKDDKQAVYCVEDNGIGIAPEYHEKIFEIFERLDPTAGAGEGLGLTIVRGIADRHSGKIWLESEPGKGSRFFVSLPAA